MRNSLKKTIPLKKRTLNLLAAVMIGLPLVVAHGAELRVGFSTDAVTMDPGNHRHRETETIIRNMYDGLLTRDSKMNVVPELAESWKAIGIQTYEFTVRRGVTFHDGTPLTADDVAFTFERLITEGALGGQTSPRKDLLGPLKAVRVVDSRVVHFVFGEPWPMLPAMLPFQEVVSKRFTEKVGPAGMARQVNGTGPFRLVEWRKGDSIIMERFEDYYGGAPGVPPVGSACVDRVIFKIISYNESRVAALLAGDVDIINDVPPHAIQVIENAPNTRIVRVNGVRSFFIALNNQSRPFSDLRVRQAVAHAIDKAWIIDTILRGNATPISGILSPDAFGKNRGLAEYRYDPERAKKLLAEAGYPGGVDVALDVDEASKSVAERIALQLSKVGIRTKIVVGEVVQLQEKWRTQGKPKTGDMWFTSWGNSSLDPVGIFVPTHRTSARGNSAGYGNPELDALLDAAGVELDRRKRADMYRKAEAVVNRDLPYVYLWVPRDAYGLSTRVAGWHPSPDSRINLHDVCVK
jgi:peptide/nickel transport system substrate-binding protein